MQKATYVNLVVYCIDNKKEQFFSCSKLKFGYQLKFFNIFLVAIRTKRRLLSFFLNRFFWFLCNFKIPMKAPCFEFTNWSDNLIQIYIWLTFLILEH